MLSLTKKILIPRRSHGHWFWLHLLIISVIFVSSTIKVQDLVFAQSAPQCSPGFQNANINEPVNFSATGGSPGRSGYTWYASNGNPSGGTGYTFQTTFANPGQYSVGAYDSLNQGHFCTVNVTAPNFYDNRPGAACGLAGTTCGGQAVQPGGTYRVIATLENRGSATAPQSHLRVRHNTHPSLLVSGSMVAETSKGYGCVYTDPSCPAHSKEFERGFSEGITTQEQQKCGPDAAHYRHPCWYWGFSDVAPGADGAAIAVFRFQVSPTAPQGTSICFTYYAHPGTPTNIENIYTAGFLSCVTVQGEPVGPPPQANTVLHARDGSVHAGARFGSETCLETGTDTVRGLSGSSRGDLAVSAAGRISNFGSGGSASGTNLTFGNQNPADLGYYGQVCRPDLYQNYDNLPLNSSSTLSISQIPDGISRYNNLTLTGGTVPRDFNATIVVDGTLTITGNIDYTATGYTSKADIPSFGVIAADNINFAPSVSRVYGIYYAGSTGRTGRINTCQSAGTYPNPVITSNASSCNTPLTVNGALIATSIYFRRTATSSTAETVNYLPQLMLNPPVGLSVVTEQL